MNHISLFLHNTHCVHYIILFVADPWIIPGTSGTPSGREPQTAGRFSCPSHIFYLTRSHTYIRTSFFLKFSLCTPSPDPAEGSVFWQSERCSLLAQSSVVLPCNMQQAACGCSLRPRRLLNISQRRRHFPFLSNSQILSDTRIFVRDRQDSWTTCWQLLNRQTHGR